MLFGKVTEYLNATMDFYTLLHTCIGHGCGRNSGLEIQRQVQVKTKQMTNMNLKI